MQEIPAEDPEFSPICLSSFADDEEHISLDGLRAPYKAQTEIPLPSPTVRLGDLGTVFNTPIHPTKRSLTQPCQNRPLKTAKTL